MKIEIECVGCRLEPVEELFVSSTLGSAVRSYDREVIRAEVPLWASRRQGDGDFRCAIELQTRESFVLLDGTGSSSTSAFMQAAEGLDRALFDRIFASRVSEDARGQIAE